VPLKLTVNLPDVQLGDLLFDLLAPTCPCRRIPSHDNPLLTFSFDLVGENA
jgi:hypothetical protein